jgi:hypothetical protein
MRVFQWIKEEVIQVIPAVIYFAIAFNLIHFNEALVLRPLDVRFYSTLSITLSALIAGKVLIIANCFRFINAFPNKPLIYNIAWQSLVYAVFIFLIRLSDSFFHGFLKTKHVNEAFTIVRHELSQPIFWSSQIWLFIVFLIFIVFTEFTRVLGKEKVKKMLFG